MIQIDEIMDVSYRKKIGNQKGSNVYVKMVANFCSENMLEYSARTVELGLIELEQKSGSNYNVGDPNTAIFFHSKFTSDSKYRIRI
jgi:hypothetical protein